MRLVWNDDTPRQYESGVDRGVLYFSENSVHSWSGLVSVNERTPNSDATPSYYDGQKYYKRRGAGNFEATIEAFTHPDEFYEHDGHEELRTSQRRDFFGLSYRVTYGSSYKIHIIYNALASPTQKSYDSLSSSASPTLMSWDITTKPLLLEDGRRVSHVIIDTSLMHPYAVEVLENHIYGSEEDDAGLPSIEDLRDLVDFNSHLRITDHGDGTWTAEGPDQAIKMLSDTSFEIDWPSAIYLDDVTYEISSL